MVCKITFPAAVNTKGHWVTFLDTVASSKIKAVQQSNHKFDHVEFFYHPELPLNYLLKI